MRRCHLHRGKKRFLWRHTHLVILTHINHSTRDKQKPRNNNTHDVSETRTWKVNPNNSVGV
ncbi:hypothetical protein B0T21DRAFT_370127 [Apiosordaria backusii]|uniref:Uncharacterized protein n=1 Tax=Apiosordaria backusii TaxID=314023 RepID=A0AA40B7F1_9PEZI|nr:hypothetical protein B0T21DRAFT_370127 [Apiosordaria backusii]